MTAHTASPGELLARGSKGFRTVVCADWGGPVAKRRVFAADLEARNVSSLGEGPWTVQTVLDKAAVLAANGAVLVAFDVPLGIPARYLDSARQSVGLGAARGFLELLPRACWLPGFFEPSCRAAEWHPARPFFAVPRGTGALKAYERQMSVHGAAARRDIDVRARAKPIFVSSGIPGSVGTATIDVWRDLGPLFSPPRSFAIWPFEGLLADLVRAHEIVVAEIYPRAAYATALLGTTSIDRPRVAIAKKHECCRAACVSLLQAMPWVSRHSVTLRDTSEAVANEDSFDALMTAAALLRCALEAWPVAELNPLLHIEGSILATATVDLSKRERRLGCTDLPLRRGRHDKSRTTKAAR